MPQTEFRVIANKSPYPSIFWIAENEETKNETKKESRLQLNVSIIIMNTGPCALLGNRIKIYDLLKSFIVSEMFNPIIPVMYVCENKTFDELGRVIVQKQLHEKIDCPLLKLNQTFIDEYKIWISLFKDKSWTMLDHTSGQRLSTTYDIVLKLFSGITSF